MDETAFILQYGSYDEWVNKQVTFNDLQNQPCNRQTYLLSLCWLYDVDPREFDELKHIFSEEPEMSKQSADSPRMGWFAAILIAVAVAASIGAIVYMRNF